MSGSTIVDNISALVEELGTPGTTKAAMDDPGGHEGPSSHPSAKTDDPGEQAASEGARSAENTKDVKEDIPESVDSKSEATPGNAPTQDEVQLGQGVDSAKPTGEDAANERDYKGDKEDPPAGSGTDQGGTTHPASGSFGDKYSSDQLSNLDNESLFKVAADLGNEMAADIANGHFNMPAEKQAMKKLTHCSNCHKDYEGDKCGDCGSAKTASDEGGEGGEGGEAGNVDANQAAAAGEQVAKLAAQQELQASQVIENVVKHAHYRADLTAEYLREHHAKLKKEAMGPEEDPTGGEAEGEDHGSESAGGPGDGGEGGPSGGGDEIAALLAGGGGPEGAPPEEGMGGDPMGGDPMAGGPEGMPPELGGMGNEEALQQLAMALMELGIDPAELAGAGGMQGPKIASVVEEHRKSGKFQFTEAKTAGERKVRDYMKGVIREIHSRSNR